MRMTIFRFSWVVLLAGALVAPAQLSAQGADTVRTHVVRPGETLWSLAVRYLGDGERWREILSLNASLRSASSLAVGTSIRIPARAATRPQARDTARQDVRTSGPPPAPRQGRDSIRRTIFYGAQPAGGFVRQDSLRRVSTDSGVPAHVFEGISAPFVVEPEVLDGGGRCVSVGPAAASEAGGVLLHGTLSVQLPAGVAADTGSRWLLVRRGPVIPELGTVAIPTGVVRLTSAVDAAPSAEILAQFDAMSCTDIILPAEVPPALPRGTLTPVTDGASGTIAWVASESLLPTLQHALILDMGVESGVKIGDRVTVYGATGNAVVASAEVVRVDRRSATALVVRQTLGSLAAGLRVRVTEKLP
jgi:hypothetical protein